MVFIHGLWLLPSSWDSWVQLFSKAGYAPLSIAPHPHKIVDGRRHYLIRAIPYQDPQREAERLKAVHEARVKIVPRV